MKEFNGDNVIIMCCSKCNSNCSHCYIEYKGDLSCKELELMIDKLKDKYSISLNGSELLLNSGYLSLLKKVNQDRVLTNGLIIHNNELLINKLKTYGINWVCMSYHFSLHNIVSNIDKQIILDNIKVLKENKFNVEIMTTISATNYLEVEKMVKEAVSLNADCIRFTNLFQEGKAINNYSNLILDDDKVNKFFDQFYMCKEKYKQDILVRRSGTFSRDYRKTNSSFYCPSMEKAVAISPNYNVYPCPFLIKDGFEIGKYEDGKIYLEDYYENDNTTCMLHEVLNRRKKYVRKRYEG